MRKDMERQVFKDRSQCLAGATEVRKRLTEDIQVLFGRHGVGMETLVGTLEEALVEVDPSAMNAEISSEELRSYLLALVLWRLFGRGTAPWISLRTKAGNEVSVDVLAPAYAMWRKAMTLAATYKVDRATAAAAFVEGTHATADELAGSSKGRHSREIHDVRNYLFATYIYMILGIAGTQGSTQTSHFEIADSVTNHELRSNKSASLEGLESDIHCREFLDVMPPKGKSVAIARYILGYSWPKTARALNFSINAAQKTLTTVRKAIGSMKELRRARYC